MMHVRVGLDGRNTIGEVDKIVPESFNRIASLEDIAFHAGWPHVIYPVVVRPEHEPGRLPLPVHPASFSDHGLYVIYVPLSIKFASAIGAFAPEHLADRFTLLGRHASSSLIRP